MQSNVHCEVGSLEEYRNKLVEKILSASSQDAVKRYCEAAIKGLKDHQVNGHLIDRFVEKIIQQLEQYSPLDKNFQQWSNITTARIFFNRRKNGR